MFFPRSAVLTVDGFVVLLLVLLACFRDLNPAKTTSGTSKA